MRYKQKYDAEFFLNEIENAKPKYFLEIGVFHGVTARNVCELLNRIHKDKFNYIGLDLFEQNQENISEIMPNTNFSNPFKQIYFKYIKKQNPYSIEAVEDLLKKFKKNVHLIKGNSNHVLKKLNMSLIDYVFLDGGHGYDTVKNDLNNCTEVILNDGIILCDDYNLSYAPGVKRAINEYVTENKFKCTIFCNERFAKIEKN